MEYKIGINIHCSKRRAFDLLHLAQEDEQWIPNFWRKVLLKGEGREVKTAYTYYVNINRPKIYDEEILKVEAPDTLVMSHQTDYYSEVITYKFSERSAVNSHVDVYARVEFLSFLQVLEYLPPVFFKKRRERYLLDMKKHLDSNPTSAKQTTSEDQVPSKPKSEEYLDSKSETARKVISENTAPSMPRAEEQLASVPAPANQVTSEQHTPMESNSEEH